MAALAPTIALGLAALAGACGGDVAVDTPNLPPAAAFGSACAGLACTFTDSSTDADGRLATYRWSFGDGSAYLTSWDASHAYTAPGTYTVELAVTDDSGAIATASRSVSVSAPPVSGPALGISRSLLMFCYEPHWNALCMGLAEPIKIFVVGGGALGWTAVSDQRWLVVSPASGTTPSRDVVVSVDTTVLPPRRGLPHLLLGQVTILAAGASNGPRTVRVEFVY